GETICYMCITGRTRQVIANRTNINIDNSHYLQAGAGVVADSVPENEWQETLNKGRAIFAAVNIMLRGLTPEQAAFADVAEEEETLMNIKEVLAVVASNSDLEREQMQDVMRQGETCEATPEQNGALLND